MKMSHKWNLGINGVKHERNEKLEQLWNDAYKITNRLS